MKGVSSRGARHKAYDLPTVIKNILYSEVRSISVQPTLVFAQWGSVHFFEISENIIDKNWLASYVVLLTILPTFFLCIVVFGLEILMQPIYEPNSIVLTVAVLHCQAYMASGCSYTQLVFCTGPLFSHFTIDPANPTLPILYHPENVDGLCRSVATNKIQAMTEILS